MVRFAILLVSLCTIGWAFAPPVSAYLDPGAGSALLQALVGGLAVAAALITHRWRQLRGWLTSRGRRPEERTPEP